MPLLETYFAGWQHRYLPVDGFLFPGHYIVPGAKLPLLLQYALGQEPGDRAFPFQITPSHQAFEIRYVRNLRRTDVAIQVEASEDLYEWSIWDPPEILIDPLDEHTEEVRLPVNEKKAFYRIRARVP